MTAPARAVPATTMRRRRRHDQDASLPAPAPTAGVSAAPWMRSMLTATRERATGVPGLAPGVNRLPVHQRQELVAAIGTTYGNRQVQRLLARQPAAEDGSASPRPAGTVAGVIQKDPPKGGAKQPAKKPKIDWPAVVTEVTNLRQEAASRVGEANTYLQAALPAADQTRAKLDTAGANYEEAYNQHKSVLDRAKEEAASRDAMISTFIGIGIGVATGMIGGAVIGATATMRTRLVAELIGEAAEAGLGVGVKALGGSSGAGYTPSAVNPLAMRTKHYNMLIDLYRGLAITGSEATGQGLVLATATDLMHQARRHAERQKADVPADKLLKLIADLRSAVVPISYPARGVADLQEAIAKKPVPSAWALERFLWVYWINRLGWYDESSDRYYFGDTDILDTDAVENYLHGSIGVLGEGSLLGVDFGRWTSEDDEEEAVQAANAKWSELMSEYRHLIGP
jgi:hypothetical protein